MEHICGWLWLVMVFGAGNHKIWDVLEKWETPEQAYEKLREHPPEQLPEKIRRAITGTTLEQASTILKQCEEKHISLVTYDDEGYPETLKRIYNPPVILFYQGNLELLHEYPLLTVVGTRKPSAYSVRVADSVCQVLAKCGMVLVSGFAVGLDSVAHRAGLLNGGKTVAVLGSGLDVAYPKENAGAKKFIVKRGLLLTEFLPGASPRPYMFPMRNRILAGVSSGTLVVQAGIGSGALITASQSLEQGKPVFCIPPADIFDKQYAGVVKYLREGAISVFEPEDILNEYYGAYEHKLTEIKEIPANTEPQPETAPKPVKKRTKAEATAPAEAVATAPVKTIASPAIKTELTGLSLRIVELLEQRGAMQIDQIVEELQTEADEVAAILTELAIEQTVVRMPSQYYGLA